VTQQDRTALVALREALQDAVDDAEARWDMDSPSTNPGIKGWVERGRAALSALPSGGAEGPTREQVEALVHDAYTNGLALPETVGPRATRMADAYCRDVLALYAEPAKEQK
jgi:hypothetical protein